MTRGYMYNGNMLTKSDFLIFIESPLHLWAKVNNQYKKIFTEYDNHLTKQGYEVENLAREYAKRYLGKEPQFQKEYKTEKLLSKADIVVGNSIYEVKSSTKIEKEHEYDLLFQYYVSSKVSDIEKIFIVYLNKEYTKVGDINLEELFVVEDMTDFVKENLHLVEGLIEEALLVQKLESPKGLKECYKPKDCPCINLCHPILPEYSIYDIAMANEKTKEKLREQGILDIKDVPYDFKLSAKQKKQIEVAKQDRVYADKEMIKNYLSALSYPIHFLDYETYSWAVPRYENHKVYQFVVFQYSLHILHADGSMVHKEFLSTTKEDPLKEILENMKKDIEEKGSILVWNKSFEMGCNKEMARIFPEEQEYIQKINSRIYDLGDIFSKQMYIDPKFKGSWSIKNVLPVLVPSLSYKDLDVQNGTQAMVGWEKIVYGNLSEKEKSELYNSLLEYCKLDTLAMYEIYKFLVTFLNS